MLATWGGPSEYSWRKWATENWGTLRPEQPVSVSKYEQLSNPPIVNFRPTINHTTAILKSMWLFLLFVKHWQFGRIC